MDQRRSQGGRHGRHREDRRDHSREDRRGHSREDRHGQRREDRHGHSQEDRHGHRAEGRRGHGGEGRHGQRREDSHGWRREDRHGHSGENRYGQRREDRRGHSRENREHEQEHWEGHPHSGQDDYYNSGYEGAQEDYPPQDQRGYRDSRYGEQEAYPPMDQRGHHDSRHQPEQEDYPPMDQRGHHDSRHQPDQGNYPPMDQRGHHDSRRQPEQEDYPFMDQRGHHDSRHQPEQEDYPPMDQHGHHESRHQPEQEDYPPMDQHGHNESRHQPEQEDYPPTDQHGHHESTYQQEQDEYPHQDQNGHVDLKYQGYYPPMDQGRFSSPGHRQQKKQDEYISPEEKEKHPILRRRIISDGHRVLNPMGMRLRRCLPKFDFDAFTKQLGEDELKTFLPHQHSQAGSVYQGEGEEETKERRQFAKEIVGMMEDGETGKGTAGKKVSSFDKKWKYAKTQMWEALQWLVVWRGSFKGIEAQHGSSTTSYFSVLRWLMFLNLFVAVTMVATIVLPQVYFHPDTFTEYRKPLNLANGKPTRQSNEYGVSYNSSEAVDGIKGNESCSRAMASEGTGSTWWQVNLTAVYEIRKVVITTLYGERSDYTVNVINAMSGNSTCRQTERQKNSNSTVEVTCPPGVHGTIVRISETSNETLWLCEVEVYGPPTGGFVKNASYCSDIYKQKMGNLMEEEGISDKVIAVIQGTGWVERTVLFTGHYFNKTFEFKDFTQRSYNMPLAFLFTTITYFFITLVLMILYTGDGVKQSLLSSDEDTHLVFNKVFSGWDYSLMQVEAAELKMKDLVKDFKIYVDQIMEKEKRKAVHTKLKYAARAFVNLLVLVTWAGSGYVIYMVITKWTDDLAKTDIVQKQNVLALFVEFLPSATITALNIVVPAIFSTLVTIEYLSPDAVVEITVARSVILRLASVVVLVVSLHARINDCRNDNEDGCKNCKEIPCWETYVGIEFYKLVVMDFIVTIITTGVEFIRRIVANHLGDEALFGRLMAMKEFNLPANVLDIVYAQTICWIGAFFCPLIPAITVVKFFLYFYLKKITLLRNFPSSPSAFRASKTNSFFMAILLVSFVLCAIAMAFVIGRLHPSQSCGPWRVYSKDDYYMYVSMSDLVATAPHVWGDILGFLISWLFYVPMLILMSLVIYYNMAMAAGHKMIINILRSEMVLEGQKKQFNLKQLLNTLMDPAKQQTNKKHKRHK